MTAIDKQPLWHRMYFQPHYTALVREVGYAGLSLKAAEKAFAGMDYPREKLDAARAELFEVANGRVMLTAQARKLAFQMLGPEKKPVDPLKEVLKTTSLPKVELPSELSPLMKQWVEAKEKHPGMTLLFRVGDFYESFSEDAYLISKTLGLTVTTRDKDIPMAGFVHSQLEIYLPKLLAAGLKVAVCEPVEQAPEKKGRKKK